MGIDSRMTALLVWAALLVLLAAAGVALVRARQRRRAAEAVRREEEDFELRFPDGPGDQPVRQTVIGRRIARR